MDNKHLTNHAGSHYTVCGEFTEKLAASQMELADTGKTYGIGYCVDCAEQHRKALVADGVNVVLLDAKRHAARRAA